MSAERLIASHLRLANEALEGARLLLAGDNRNTVYLAEQAVEQMILAVAQAEVVHFPRSAQHQLDTMLRSFPKENTVASAFLDLVWLEAYVPVPAHARRHRRAAIERYANCDADVDRRVARHIVEALRDPPRRQGCARSA